MAPDTVTPAITNINQMYYQQVDSQLTRMLLVQSFIELVSYVPYGASVLYSNITDGWDKSNLRVAWEQLIIYICRMASYLFAVSSFYVSMLANRGFRKQFFRSFGIKSNGVATLHMNNSRFEAFALTNRSQR